MIRMYFMEKTLYFDRPTQVAFCDEEGTWKFGIAYCGEIICGCCGAVIPLNLFKEGQVEELRWQDISTAIAE